MEKAGLDDDKLSLLAKWAAGLRDDQRAEVAAAGRAIEMLIDEVERLNVLIWERRLAAGEAGLAQIWQGRAPEEPPQAAPEADVLETEELQADGDVLPPLHARLRKRARTALRPHADA